MPAPTANPPDIDRTRSFVTQPERTVTIGERTFPAGDVDIRITHDGTVATFKVAVWNLTQSSFHAIRQGDPISVRIGWRNAASDEVVRGEITAKSSTSARADDKYTLQARSLGAAAVRTHLTKSWNNVSVNTVVRGIAAELDLEVGVLGPPADAEVSTAAPRLRGYWQLRQNRPVRAWLDDLAGAASRETGHQFEWYVDRGALSFHPKRTLPERTTRLTTADSIRELQPFADDLSVTNSAMAMRAIGFATPHLRRDAAVVIAHTTGGKARKQGGNVPWLPSAGDGGGDATERYRLARYTISSGTEVGHHQFIGILVPDNARYAVRQEAN